ncbi:sucrose-phosphatase-like protein [Arabidopsis thaliana]|nr:sucrose-phosphatase-like protein [Arabidopsis thaliana]NP_001326932.1 sucrose-phosphatase-like protein [Arabidopsis thaliana]NP_001326933.1 sucrose-phosphatase-like protein [Arabidopsis thaliana]NP_001326934.1 sucrose-phosphatase-like protein [Arabidopsis thaliana]NP_001326935.1 sucrose-phosphatase-like protein [Arabidopsis thaliana]NP_001326936.1 sucrose-phosphatase-like protein [Arabidopsis thaliana]ANM64930.1 sucrose-phosphatase-like protein [Arabidopsis thaliana]ANM64931.1 sucrose-pho|eukprot:NP_001326931.1 sucrose-phosphatase-like protein [Arabidopsis thaliana]
MLTEKPVISLKTKGNKKKKTKKQELASDSISKPKLLTEKPEVSWKVNGKKKTEANASSPAKDATDSKVSFSKPTKSSSQVQDQKSKSQKKISPSSEPENETISKGSATSNTLSSVLVIRIGNLNSKTADSLIHSMCFSIGPLEGLTRVNEDTVDVLFRLKDLKEADSILEELNDATVDNSQWTAEIVLEAEEASKNQMGMRITSCLEDLDKQLLMQRILGKDLEVLLHSVMHLENHPMARGRD